MRTIDVDIGNGRVAQITRPDREDFAANLGGAVQYALANVITWIAETSGGALGAFGGSALVSFLETIEPGLVEYYSPIIEQIQQIPGIPDWFSAFLDKIQHPESEVGAAVSQAVIGSAAGGVTSSLLGVLLSPLTYGLNEKVRPARPVLPDLLAMRWREEIDTATFDDWAADQGWPVEAIRAYHDVLRPRPTVADLISWAWRVHQEPEVIREELGKRGFDGVDIDRYMELAKRIPSPGDLVTFALREVWRPEIRPELLEPDAPELYYELMQKQGYDRDTAADYWASHWRLPSAAQGFEMFWRLDEFTEADLKQLLVRLDILPAYQDKLIKIAYSPITRVDVRRMHATGQISDEDLPRHYRDIGFSPEYAAMMAEFTIRYNAGTELDYTKSEIIKGYNLGMLTAEEAVSLFVDIGKSEDYAIFILALEEYKRQADILEQETDIVKDLYIKWEIDETTARARLTQLALRGSHIERLIEEWSIQRRAKITLLTRAQVEEFYKDGVITEAEARIELHKKRYLNYAIRWLIVDWDQQIVEAARKEAERAQKEQERMAKAKFRTRRSMALANFNRLIAEQRLMIAELKVAAFYAEAGPQVRALNEQKSELWRAYTVAETDAERERIAAEIAAINEQLAVYEEMLVTIQENILIAKEDIATRQLEKAELPVVIEEGG